MAKRPRYANEAMVDLVHSLKPIAAVGRQIAEPVTTNGVSD